MRTYRGNGVDRRDKGKVCNPVSEEHLPKSTSATREYEPQAADGHDKDNQIKGHSCERFIREGSCGGEKDGLTVHVQCLENGRGCASDDALAQLGSPFRLDLEGGDGRTVGQMRVSIK